MVSYFGSDLEFNTIYPKMQEFLEIGEDSDPVISTNSSPIVHIAGWTRHYRQTSYLVLDQLPPVSLPISTFTQFIRTFHVSASFFFGILEFSRLELVN